MRGRNSCFELRLQSSRNQINLTRFCFFIFDSVVPYAVQKWPTPSPHCGALSRARSRLSKLVQVPGARRHVPTLLHKRACTAVLSAAASAASAIAIAALHLAPVPWRMSRIISPLYTTPSEYLPQRVSSCSNAMATAMRLRKISSHARAPPAAAH